MLPFIPIIGTMLAEKGLDFLSDLVSSSTDTGIDKIKNFIETGTGIDITNKSSLRNLAPEQIEALKKIESEDRQALLSFQLETKKADHANTMDARAMYKTVLEKSSSSIERHITLYLAIIIIGFTCLSHILPWFITPPTDNIRLIDNGSQLMYSMSLIIVGYYFGSSNSGISRTSSSVPKTTTTSTPVTPVDDPLTKRIAAARSALTSSQREAYDVLIAEGDPHDEAYAKSLLRT